MVVSRHTKFYGYLIHVGNLLWNQFQKKYITREIETFSRAFCYVHPAGNTCATIELDL